MERMLMNPATGSVASESEWLEDFENMSADEWGGDSFEDGGLIEVVPNTPDTPGYDEWAGEWREAD